MDHPYKREGKIELHGARLFCKVLESEEEFPTTNLQLIPGDTVSISEKNTLTFIKRFPFHTLGTVKKVVNGEVYLHLPFFGPACPSIIKVKVESHNSVGDRYHLFFPATTQQPDSIKTYSSSSNDDVEVLLNIYSAHTSYKRIDYKTFPKKDALYTKEGVIDHTDHFTITIDPDTAKDFDDAISFNEETKEVFIHIVDIAHASITKEEEDRLQNRCQTLYLGHDKTAHLLSEENASYTLSLVENEPRHTITTRVKLNENGFVENYDIYRSIIKVNKRLTYNKSWEYIPEWLFNLLAKQDTELKYNIHLPSLSFTPSTQIIKTDTSDRPHKFVERCMVLSNMIVSKHLQVKNIYLPNRFHSKLLGFRPLTPEEMTNNAEVDSFLLLKKYARAKYAVDEHGHFGLGLEEYCHFTSPMRRYADVLVHRLLAGWDIPKEILEKEVDIINSRERLVDSCHRYYFGWKMNRYIESFGTQKAWDVWITGFGPAGVNWFMPELNLNGFCFVGYLLPVARYTLKNNSLESDKSSFKLGDSCKAYFMNIDPVTYVVNVKIEAKVSG